MEYGMRNQGENELVFTDFPAPKNSEIVDLQMKMAMTSVNHEYTRKAYDKTRSFMKRQELLLKMAELKQLYFSARDKLAALQPQCLETIENELAYQKQVVLADYPVH